MTTSVYHIPVGVCDKGQKVCVCVCVSVEAYERPVNSLKDGEKDISSSRFFLSSSFVYR